MKLSTMVLSCVCATLAAAQADASPLFKITETYVGISGPDGTLDWIEVTNFGDMAGDTGTLHYDDVSQDIGDAGQLTSFSLAPGKSAVFLVTEDLFDEDNGVSVEAEKIDEFKALWGQNLLVGAVAAPYGGGLGQGGDTAAILLGDGTVVDTLEYAVGPGSATLEDPTGMGTPTESLLGVNYAYGSAPFLNENINPFPGGTISLVGSPGFVPEPGTFALLAAGVALAATRRRG